MVQQFGANPLNMIFNMLGGGGGAQPSYQSQPGYFPNTLSYNPNSGLINMLMGYLKSKMFPNAKPMAPSWMSQYDFERIIEQTKLRKTVSSQYESSSPLPIMAMSNLLSSVGIKDSMAMFIGPKGETTQMGKMVSDMFSRLMGPYSGSYGKMGNFQNMVRDVSAGSITGLGSFYREGGGLSNLQSKKIVQDIMKGTYSDDYYTKQRGFFNAQDMSEVYRIGKDYQVLAGAKPGEIAGRTQAFGRVIKQAMHTFGTPNKEQALQALIESTGGAIPLTNTTELEEALRKIKDLSKSANISIKLLASVMGRGAEVAKQLNMPGSVGTNIAISALGRMRVMQNLPALTGTKNEFYTPEVIAQVGGIRRASIIEQDVSQQFLASTGMRRNAGILGAFTKLGLNTTNLLQELKQGPLTADRDAYYRGVIGKRLAQRYKVINPQITEEEAGRSAVEGTLELMKTNAGKGQKIISEENVVTSAMDARIMTLFAAQVKQTDRKELFGSVEKMQGIMRALNRGEAPKEKLTKNELKTIQPFLQKKVLGPSKEALGLTPAGIKMISAGFMERLTHGAEINKAAKLQDELTKKINIEEVYKEKYRQSNTPLSRILSGISEGGGLWESIKNVLPQATNIYNLEADSENVVRQVRNLQSLWGTSRGRLFYESYRNITGTTLKSSEQAKLFIKKLGRVKPGNIQVADQDTLSKIKKDKQIKSIIKEDRLLSVSDIEKVTGAQPIEKSLAVIKGLSEESFTGIANQIKNAQAQKFTNEDILGANLISRETPLTTAELNVRQDVQRIVKRIGEEAFVTRGTPKDIQELSKVATETKNKDIIRDVASLTGIGYEQQKAKDAKKIIEVMKTIREKSARERANILSKTSTRASLDPNSILLAAKELGDEVSPVKGTPEDYGDIIDYESSINRVVNKAYRESGIYEALQKSNSPEDVIALESKVISRMKQVGLSQTISEYTDKGAIKLQDLPNVSNIHLGMDVYKKLQKSRKVKDFNIDAEEARILLETSKMGGYTALVRALGRGSIQTEDLPTSIKDLFSSSSAAVIRNTGFEEAITASGNSDKKRELLARALSAGSEETIMYAIKNNIIKMEDLNTTPVTEKDAKDIRAIFARAGARDRTGKFNVERELSNAIEYATIFGKKASLKRGLMGGILRSKDLHNRNQKVTYALKKNESILRDYAALYGLPTALMKLAKEDKLDIKDEADLVKNTKIAEVLFKGVEKKILTPEMLVGIAKPKTRLNAKLTKSMLEKLNISQKIKFLKSSTGQSEAINILADAYGYSPFDFSKKGESTLQQLKYEVSKDLGKKLDEENPIMRQAEKLKEKMSSWMSALTDALGVFFDNQVIKTIDEG